MSPKVTYTLWRVKMMRLKEFIESENELLDENRLVRKGLGLVLGRQSKIHGDKSVQNFKNSQRLLSNPSKDMEKRMDNLEKGLIEYSEGMINLRKQIGSLVSMVNLSILLSERTDKQISKLSKKR